MGKVVGSFTANGQSASLRPLTRSGPGPFNISIWGTFAATVALERQFDGDSTWLPVTYPDGTALSWTAPVSTGWEESEGSV